MTVAEIQEFIIEKLNNKPILEIQNYGENEPQKLFVPLEHYGKTLEEIKSMLDELDERLKAKWVKQDYSTGYSEYGTASICSKCGSEVINKTNYCSNCGTRMENENDD